MYFVVTVIITWVMYYYNYENNEKKKDVEGKCNLFFFLMSFFLQLTLSPTFCFPVIPIC